MENNEAPITHTIIDMGRSFAEGLQMKPYKILQVSGIPDYFLAYVHGKYHLSKISIKVAKQIFIATLEMNFKEEGNIIFDTPEAEKWWREILTFENTEIPEPTKWNSNPTRVFKQIVRDSFPKHLFKIDRHTEFEEE